MRAAAPDAAAPPRKQTVRLRVTPADDDAQPPTIAVDNSPPRRGALAEQEDPTVYKVVLNHEEQYSIWPADRENPLGWKDAGKAGSKTECLDFIKEVWTDMRPLSLRRQMDGGESDA